MPITISDLSSVTSADTLPAEFRGRGVTVYGASSSAIDPGFKTAARELGRGVANLGLTLISGGGREGLMASAIEGADEAGGTTVGILPDFMIARSWNHPLLSHTLSVPDMHTRKNLMATMAGVVVAMPGGIGTFEELLEIITWRQLSLWLGTVVILNTAGYYSHLLAMLAEAERLHFMRRPGAGAEPLFQVASTPDETLAIIKATLCD